MEEGADGELLLVGVPARDRCSRFWLAVVEDVELMFDGGNIVTIGSITAPSDEFAGKPVKI